MPQQHAQQHAMLHRMHAHALALAVPQMRPHLGGAPYHDMARAVHGVYALCALRSPVLEHPGLHVLEHPGLPMF